MGANNLRIIYNNLADSATITVSSTASSSLSGANLLKDSKAYVWRSGTSSTTTAKGNIVVQFNTAQIIGGIILPFCNLSSVSTIRVRGYTGAPPTLGGTIDSPTISASGTLIFDTGTISAAPYIPLGSWAWGTQPLGVNTYSYSGGTYARVWLDNHYTVSSIVIEIIDTNSTSQYIEAARLIVGPYWSPKYNTGYGMTMGVNESSSHSRTTAGNLITTRGSRYRELNFDLNWLTSSDKTDLLNILYGNGMLKSIFVSLFPNNSSDWSLEQSHQIYGRLSQLSPITYANPLVHSSSIKIEEV